MVAVEIRDAVEEDLPVVVDIYNSTVPSRMVTADPEPVSIESRRAWFCEHDPRTRPIWVAEVGGEVAGWFSFENFRKKPAYYATAEVSVYVSEKHRRKGIERRLLQRAIHRAPELGLKTLTGASSATTSRASGSSRTWGSSAGRSIRGSRSSTASSETWSCWACASIQRVKRPEVCNAAASMRLLASFCKIGATSQRKGAVNFLQRRTLL